MSLGVAKGDRVAIWAQNCWEWVVAYLGIESIGGVLVPLNTRYKGHEAANILRRSRAKVLCTVQGFLGADYIDMLDEGEVGELPNLEHIVMLRSYAMSMAFPPAPVTSLEDLLEIGDDYDWSLVRERVESVTGADMSDLLFTSGTTGSPKGVIQTHAQTLRAFADWADVVGLQSSDRYLVINPFFHSFGCKAGIVAGLTAGCTLIPLPVFDIDAVVEMIELEQVTMIPGPPTIYQTLLNHPNFDPEQSNSLRLAVTGAAVVPVELVHAMRDILGFETVVTGYGLTESCGIATMCRHDDDPTTIAQTSGRAIPSVEVQVVDEDGTPVPPGESGEVVIRGYNVMRGYFEDPEQTAETIDADGWLHSGDIGVMDSAGYLRITDRLKDMFIVGGFNAYPAEIEALLLAHPSIAQVAVVGVPDERLGEVGYAYVLPTTGTHPDPAEIVSWARDNMANFKVPRHVEIVEELPLNASGKVLKYELRQRAMIRHAQGG